MMAFQITLQNEPGPRLNRATATEAATHMLRELILSGAVPSDVALRQDELAAQLGVSRTPLREALHRLTAEGLIRLDHHKGAMVATPSIAELKEIYELQEVLECRAVAEAILHRSEADLVELRARLEDFSRARDSLDWIRYNLAFHAALYKISRKPLLVEMITLLRNRASLYINMVARSDESRKRAEEEHVEMVMALEDGDSERLQKQVREHLGATIGWVESVITDSHGNAL
jgi:DNA-binding GntR family transcriptional regulator